MTRSLAFSAAILLVLALATSLPAGVLLTAQKVELLNPLAGFTAWELGLETDDDSLLQAFDATLSGSFNQSWFDKDFDSLVDTTGRGAVDGRADSHLVLPGNALVVRDPNEDNTNGTGSFLTGVWGVPGSTQASSTSLAYLVLPTDGWDLSVDLKIATSAGLVEFRPDTLLSAPDPTSSGRTVLASAAVIPPPPPPSLPEVIEPPAEVPASPPPVAPTVPPYEEPRIPEVPYPDLPEPPAETPVIETPVIETPVIETPVSDFPSGAVTPTEGGSVGNLPPQIDIRVDLPGQEGGTASDEDVDIEIPITLPELNPVNFPYIVMRSEQFQWLILDPAFTDDGTISLVDVVAYDGDALTLPGLLTNFTGAEFVTRSLLFSSTRFDGAVLTDTLGVAGEITVPEPNSLVIALLFLPSALVVTRIGQRAWRHL